MSNFAIIMTTCLSFSFLHSLLCSHLRLWFFGPSKWLSLHLKWWELYFFTIVGSFLFFWMIVIYLVLSSSIYSHFFAFEDAWSLIFTYNITTSYIIQPQNMAVESVLKTPIRQLPTQSSGITALTKFTKEDLDGVELPVWLQSPTAILKAAGRAKEISMWIPCSPIRITAIIICNPRQAGGTQSAKAG